MKSICHCHCPTCSQRLPDEHRELQLQGYHISEEWRQGASCWGKEPDTHAPGPLTFDPAACGAGSGRRVNNGDAPVTSGCKCLGAGSSLKCKQFGWSATSAERHFHLLVFNGGLINSSQWQRYKLLTKPLRIKDKNGLIFPFCSKRKLNKCISFWWALNESDKRGCSERWTMQINITQLCGFTQLFSLFKSIFVFLPRRLPLFTSSHLQKQAVVKPDLFKCLWR